MNINSMFRINCIQSRILHRVKLVSQTSDLYNTAWANSYLRNEVYRVHSAGLASCGIWLLMVDLPNCHCSLLDPRTAYWDDVLVMCALHIENTSRTELSVDAIVTLWVNPFSDSFSNGVTVGIEGMTGAVAQHAPCWVYQFCWLPCPHR